MIRYDCSEWFSQPEPSDTGAYVRYEDAQDQIAVARAQTAVKTECLIRALDLAETALQKVLGLQRQLAEREAELAALVHPFDLEKYRSEK